MQELWLRGERGRSIEGGDSQDAKNSKNQDDPICNIVCNTVKSPCSRHRQCLFYRRYLGFLRIGSKMSEMCLLVWCLLYGVSAIEV